MTMPLIVLCIGLVVVLVHVSSNKNSEEDEEEEKEVDDSVLLRYGDMGTVDKTTNP